MKNEDSDDNNFPEKKLKNAKKKNLAGSFFKVLFSFIVVIFFIIAAWCIFSVFNRKSSLSAIPRNYQVYIHSDSAFDTVNPLLDLQAADVLLAAPDFSKYRKIFMSARASLFRENKFVKFALSRQVDFAFYSSSKGENYVAVVNLGIFSAATRLADFIVPYLKIPGLTMMSAETINYYLFQQDGFSIYLKPVKNLLVASNSLELLLPASSAKNDSLYTKEQLKILEANSGDSLRIVADARQLAESFTGSDELLSSFAQLISPDSLSVVSLNISDSDIGVKIQLPAENEEDSSNSLLPILNKRSKAPAIVSRFSESVQYYTVLNAGTLPELKNAIFPLLPKSKNIDKTWNSAESLCQTAFGMSLEDLIFSWTGNEFAVFGLENHNEPVFAVQIEDERSRKKIFDSVTNSMFVNEDNSLILDGARLPRLKLPAFLNWLLSVFDISIPSPYFLVQDGFIYFSQSPENLSQIYSSASSGRTLVKSSNYQLVSSGQKSDSSVSLFYDLDTSVPFFIRSNKIAGTVLSLYPIGRFDMRTRNGNIELQLQSCARKSGNLSSVPGFPVQVDKTATDDDFCLVKSFNSLFWIENQKTIKKMNLDDLSVSETQASDSVQIAPAVLSSKLDSGILWAVTSHGGVDLLNENLESTGKFPVMLGSKPSARATAFDGGLYVPLEDERIAVVRTDASVDFIEIPDLLVKAPVAVYEKNAAVYSKGFFGNIYLIENGNLLNLDSPIEVDGIGIGSPVLWNKDSVAFISQAGKLQAWRNGNLLSNFPVQIDGVFLTNLRSSEKYLYALSADAVLYRIGSDGKILSVKIPNSTAENPHFSVQKNGSLYNIYVNADSNVIYAFNENLELLSGYPLSGWADPVFADVNGDKIDECISLTLDRQIVAWKVR